jgi:hypothetical protein
MKTLLVITAAAAAFFGGAKGHGYVTGVRVNGAGWTDGQNPNWYYISSPPATAGWKALNQDNGFVQPSSFQTSDIACHKSGVTNTKYISANAGDTLTIYWNTWPDTHKGPILNYIAPVSSMF